MWVGCGDTDKVMMMQRGGGEKNSFCFVEIMKMCIFATDF